VRVTGWPPDSDPIYKNPPYGDAFLVFMLLTGYGIRPTPENMPAAQQPQQPQQPSEQPTPQAPGYDMTMIAIAVVIVIVAVVAGVMLARRRK
jgi:hypothetical protein